LRTWGDEAVLTMPNHAICRYYISIRIPCITIINVILNINNNTYGLLRKGEYKQQQQ
jgi:hypothetical protein